MKCDFKKCAILLILGKGWQHWIYYNLSPLILDALSHNILPTIVLFLAQSWFRRTSCYNTTQTFEQNNKTLVTKCQRYIFSGNEY